MKSITHILMGCWIMAGLMVIGCRDDRQAALELPFYQNAEMTPEWIAVSNDDKDAIHRVGDFTFVSRMTTTRGGGLLMTALEGAPGRTVFG